MVEETQLPPTTTNLETDFQSPFGFVPQGPVLTPGGGHVNLDAFKKSVIYTPTSSAFHRFQAPQMVPVPFQGYESPDATQPPSQSPDNEFSQDPTGLGDYVFGGNR